MKSIPGGSLSSNKKIAGVKLWNVSSNAPQRTIRVGRSGVLNMLSLRRANTDPTHESFLLSFKNGQVGIYVLKSNRLDLVTEPNHSETIFDVQLKPNNRSVLATSSYDGTVRIWDVNEMTCEGTLGANSKSKGGIVYAVSWAPGDSVELVSGSSQGQLVVWDTKKVRERARYKVPGNSSIFRVDWSQADESLIAFGA